MMGAAVYCFGKYYFLSRKINNDPLWVEAQIVIAFPGTPNDLAKVDIVMANAFATNGQSYSKKNQTCPPIPWISVAITPEN
ncbi:MULTISPECIES: hypothetical protein [Kosakonia]|uniref:hypothetical protein n=1 Tax=Kosakonia TaxID=1330547 RepID=UPI0006990259|nr:MULTISPECIES: hypothetical protein [Kosakonia]RCW98127.1 hypothetical protein DFO56_109163 [Kosakonia sp. AG348]